MVERLRTPFTHWQVVVGKYLAAWLFLGLALILRRAGLGDLDPELLSAP